MADGSWLLVFRSLSTEELQDRKQNLLDSMTTLSSQSIGSKSLTRDLRELKVQLEAITFVLNERGMGSCGYPSSTVVDFSRGVGSTQPRGTTESL